MTNYDILYALCLKCSVDTFNKEYDVRDHTTQAEKCIDQLSEDEQDSWMQQIMFEDRIVHYNHSLRKMVLR